MSALTVHWRCDRTRLGMFDDTPGCPGARERCTLKYTQRDGSVERLISHHGRRSLPAGKPPPHERCERCWRGGLRGRCLPQPGAWLLTVMPEGSERGSTEGAVSWLGSQGTLGGRFAVTSVRSPRLWNFQGCRRGHGARVALARRGPSGSHLGRLPAWLEPRAGHR